MSDQLYTWLRRLHAEAVANAGGYFEIGTDEAFRVAMMEHAPALLDAAAERDALRAEVAAMHVSLQAARATIAELCRIDADLVLWGPGARYSQATIDEMQRRQVEAGLPPFSEDVIERVQQRREAGRE